ncbi:Panacea domain-containing protein [Sphingomonas sp. DG1-23]|uniref:type VI toxin-antitoxin system SocA family antitoxin n=1 Tax=Sphingomonas sp. DG1-23 TaxID=3068316 RepID=UPI003530B8CB
MPLDPRSVANLIIKLAVDHQRPVTNLSLQKILYFIHGRFLVENDEPLLDGYFEAWQYGPVHPLIYDSFKDQGSRPLIEPATRRDLLSGRQIPVDIPDNAQLCSFINEVTLPYLKLSAGRLVDLSHARGSPWDALTRQFDGTRTYGMRITEQNIKDKFRFHKVSVGKNPSVGEPHEESPPH